MGQISMQIMLPVGSVLGAIQHVRDNMTLEEALADAKRLDETRKSAGFDQLALDEAAKLGFSNGAFEESEEDGSDVVEEFYPETNGVTQPDGNKGIQPTNPGAQTHQDSLAGKLEAKAI